MNLEKILARWKEMKYAGRLPAVGLPASPSSTGMTKLLLALGIVTAVSAVGYGGYKAVSCAGSAVVDAVSGSSLDDYLPGGFKGLELGMSYQEVQGIRPFMRTSGQEGNSREEIPHDSATYEGILAAFGTDRSRYTRSRPISVDYSFANNHLRKVMFSIYQLWGWGQTKGVFPALGEPTWKNSQGDFRWEKGDLTIQFEVGERWTHYTLETKEEPEAR